MTKVKICNGFMSKKFKPYKVNDLACFPAIIAIMRDPTFMNVSRDNLRTFLIREVQRLKDNGIVYSNHAFDELMARNSDAAAEMQALLYLDLSSTALVDVTRPPLGVMARHQCGKTGVVVALYWLWTAAAMQFDIAKKLRILVAISTSTNGTGTNLTDKLIYTTLLRQMIDGDDFTVQIIAKQTEKNIPKHWGGPDEVVYLIHDEAHHQLKKDSRIEKLLKALRKRQFAFDPELSYVAITATPDPLIVAADADEIIPCKLPPYDGYFSAEELRDQTIAELNDERRFQHVPSDKHDIKKVAARAAQHAWLQVKRFGSGNVYWRLNNDINTLSIFCEALERHGVGYDIMIHTCGRDATDNIASFRQHSTNRPGRENYLNILVLKQGIAMSYTHDDAAWPLCRLVWEGPALLQPPPKTKPDMPRNDLPSDGRQLRNYADASQKLYRMLGGEEARQCRAFVYGSEDIIKHTVAQSANFDVAFTSAHTRRAAVAERKFKYEYTFKEVVLGKTSLPHQNMTTGQKTNANLIEFVRDLACKKTVRGRQGWAAGNSAICVHANVIDELPADVQDIFAYALKAIDYNVMTNGWPEIFTYELDVECTPVESTAEFKEGSGIPTTHALMSNLE